MIRVKDDNQTTIKVLRKGYSAKLAPMLRSRKLNSGAMHEGITEHGFQLDYIESNKQASDISTKDLAPSKWDNALRLLGFTPKGEPHFLLPEPTPEQKAKLGGTVHLDLGDDLVPAGAGQAHCEDLTQHTSAKMCRGAHAQHVHLRPLGDER